MQLAQGGRGLRTTECSRLVPVSGAEPRHVDATGYHYGAPLSFDRPVKAVFSADGSTAYILNCGPECGGTSFHHSLPVGPMIFLLGQNRELLPDRSGDWLPRTLPIPGGASNALVDTSTMYVVGQQPQPVKARRCSRGNLTVVNLSQQYRRQPCSNQRRPARRHEPHDRGRRQHAVDRHDRVHQRRARGNQAMPYGCLTMFNTSTNTVTLIEPYIGDATGIAAVTGLHKIYTAEGGQVYIYSTVDGSAIDNQYVTVTGTAYDVAYMDAITDANNTVY